MFSGPGIHKEFGWKPVGKFICAPAALTHVVTLPCDLSRTVKIISQWDRGMLSIQFDEDNANSYHFSIRGHGRLAGAASLTHNQQTATDQIFLTRADQNNIFSELLIQQVSGFLMVMGKTVSAHDGANFTHWSILGFYSDAAPHQSITFRNGSIHNMLGEVQVFESVYAF